jgi:hypothetical protein
MSASFWPSVPPQTNISYTTFGGGGANFSVDGGGRDVVVSLDLVADGGVVLANCRLAQLYINGNGWVFELHPGAVPWTLSMSSGGLVIIDYSGPTLGLGQIPATASQVTVTGLNNLTTLALPDFESLQSIYFRGSTSLAHVAPAGLFSGTCTSIDFAYCSLTQASVDAILNAAAMTSTPNGFIDLSGGMNASPSSAGLAAAAALQSMNWSVGTN